MVHGRGIQVWSTGPLSLLIKTASLLGLIDRPTLPSKIGWEVIQRQTLEHLLNPTYPTLE